MKAEDFPNIPSQPSSSSDDKRSGSKPLARKGRILRLKLGYNPNSSSIGTILFAIPAALLAVTAIFGGAMGFLHSSLVRPEEEPNRENGKTSAAGPVEGASAAKGTEEPEE
jgi:hypothetical protein